ncbi:unnamed protein product, partial [Discosporangium mesarthrocarpum]
QQVVKGVDCVGRDAARELAFTVGLRGNFVPDILRAVTPGLSEEDRKVVDNTNKLLAFLLGNSQKKTDPSPNPNPNPNPFHPFGMIFTRRTPVNPAAGLFGLRVVTPPFSLLGGGRPTRQGGLTLAEELNPIIRELGPQMREFGLQ